MKHYFSDIRFKLLSKYLIFDDKAFCYLSVIMFHDICRSVEQLGCNEWAIFELLISEKSVNRFLQKGMRRMSRSLNAKIIILVIKSASEFNLPVTKTPNTPEEYPTNCPTFCFSIASTKIMKHKRTEMTMLYCTYYSFSI